MTKKTTTLSSKLEQWQIDDAARLRAIFDEKKAATTGTADSFTNDSFAEKWGIKSGQMVWQYITAYRPLNMQAATSFARGLGIGISEFSPTIAAQVLDAAGVVGSQPSGATHDIVAQRVPPWMDSDAYRLLDLYFSLNERQRGEVVRFIEGVQSRPSAAAAGGKG